MKLNEFLSEFWGKETVTVNAEELKELIQERNKLKTQNESLTRDNDSLKNQVKYYREKCVNLEAMQPLHIDLRG